MQNTFHPSFEKELFITPGPLYVPGNSVKPVNNFLKAPDEIEKELAEASTREKEFCICIDGRLLPVSEVLRLPMEENY